MKLNIKLINHQLLKLYDFLLPNIFSGIRLCSHISVLYKCSQFHYDSFYWNLMINNVGYLDDDLYIDYSSWICDKNCFLMLLHLYKILIEKSLFSWKLISRIYTLILFLLYFLLLEFILSKTYCFFMSTYILLKIVVFTILNWVLWLIKICWFSNTIFLSVLIIGILFLMSLLWILQTNSFH